MKIPENSVIDTLIQMEQSANLADTLRGRAIGSKAGKVSVNEDPENLRRIKVNFPEHANLDSYWINRATTSPGLDEVVPKIGQSVIVDFLDGDLTKGFYRTIQNRLNNPFATDNELEDHTHVLDGDYNVTSNSSINKKAQQDINLTSSREINQEAGETITIVSNNLSKVIIKPNGEIEVSGVKIALQAAAVVEVNSPLLLLNVGAIASTGFSGGSIGSVDLNVNSLSVNNADSFSINNLQVASVTAPVDDNIDKVVGRGWI